jgi:antitoxin component of RelBE/YafQ-DinJ toxin-antitoxin module
MSSVPGPIISFRINSPDLSGAIRPALNQIKNETKATSEQIAKDWQVMTERLRGYTARGLLTDKEVTAERQKIIDLLKTQIALQNAAVEPTNKQLTNFKAMTRELERQNDALKRGTSVGVTAGTSNALSQVSLQTTLGIERVLDSLVNRYFGGAAGAAFRTARDVQYYSAQASGTARSSLFSGTNLAILGGIGAVGLSAAAITATAVAGGKLAVELDNSAKKMGLTTDAAIRLRSAAEAIEIPFDSLAPTFKKFSTELTLATTASLPNASKEAQKAGELFKILGVNVKQAAADPLVGLQQLAKSLNALPDGAIKSATANLIFGKSYESILPVLAKLPTALDATKKSSEDLAKALGVDVLNSADALRAGLINWKNESDAFEIALAQNVLPTLVKFIGLINQVGDAAKSYFTPVDRAKAAISDELHSRNQQLTPFGASQLDFFLTLQNQNSGLKGGLNSYVANRQQGISDFLGSKEGQGAGILEPFKQSINGVSEVSKATAKEMKALAGVVGNLGDGSAKAAKLAREYAELIDKAVLHPGRPSRGGSGSGEGEERPDVLIDRFLKYGTIYRSQIPNPPPDNGLLSSPFLGGSGASIPGIIGPQAGPSPTVAANVLIKQINDEHEELFKTQREIDIEHYDDELKNLKSALQDQLKSEQLNAQQKLDAQQQYNDAAAKLAADRNKTLSDIDEKYKGEAGKLFDDLLGGKGKAFGKSFETDIINIAVAPIKNIFEQSLGGLFGNLSRTVSAPFGGGGTSSGAGGFNFGGIFSGLGGLFGLGKVGPGGTGGFFPGPIGSGAGGGVGGGAGQFGVATMTVTAGVVNLTGQLGLPGTGPLGGGGSTGNFFGNLNPFSSDSNLPIDSTAMARAAAAAGIGGGSGSAAASLSGASSIFSALGPFLTGGALLGMGLGTKNVTAAIMGASSLTGTALKSAGSALASAQGISNLSDSLNIGGAAAPGIGMFVSGIMKGGVGGTIQSTLGGGEAGLALGGPIGAAIGAGVGLISGIVSSLVSGPSFAHQVQQNMYNQQYHAPPSETFSFAMGNTIADTLSTGFNQSGSHFGTYGLAAGTPFWADPITGRLSKDQQIDLAKEQMGLLSNQPFLGFPTIDPFVGQGPVGRNARSAAAQVTHVTIHAMDSESLSEFTQRNAHIFARASNSIGALSSSGNGSNARRLINLP